jgi:hypothetical protein
MSGLRSFGAKQRREVRRRNHIARDLRTPKYGPRIRESKRQHLIDELHRREMDEDYHDARELGLTSKE